MKKIISMMSMALLAAGLSVGVASPAAAQSNYCGVVDSGSDKVATGYWYTAENGRRYCRQIGSAANYVCMDSDGRLPTTTRQRPVEYRSRSWVTYTFVEVIKRPVPDASSFKPSGTYDPYAVNVGSLSRPVWQSSGARPTPEEQAAWDAQFSPEIVAIYDDDVTNSLYSEAPSELPTMTDWTYRQRTVSVPGGNYETRTRTTETTVTNLIHNTNRGNCQPDSGAVSSVRYDSIPSASYVDRRTDRQKCDQTATNAQMFNYVCRDAVPTPRVVRTSQGGTVTDTVRSEGQGGEITEQTCTKVSSSGKQTSWYCE